MSNGNKVLVRMHCMVYYLIFCLIWQPVVVVVLIFFLVLKNFQQFLRISQNPLISYYCFAEIRKSWSPQKELLEAKYYKLFYFLLSFVGDLLIKTINKSVEIRNLQKNNGISCEIPKCGYIKTEIGPNILDLAIK